MNEFDFYNELYHKENERRTSLDGMLNIPIAILTALFSFVFFLVTTYDFSVSCKINLFFVPIFCLTVILCIICFTYLAISFIGRTKNYSGIPYTQELHNWKKELIEYYQEHGTGTAEQKNELANKEFEKYLLDSFVKYVDANMIVNDYKSRNLFLGKRLLVFAIISSLILLVPYSYNYFKKAKEIHFVAIVKKINS